MRRSLISKILVVACVTVLFCTAQVNAATNGSSINQSIPNTIKQMSATDVLSNVISDMNAHDWEGYYSLSEYLCNDGVLISQYAQTNHIGACNLKNISLLKYKEIKPEDVSDIIDLSSYPSKYSDIKIYYIAVNCLTYQENEYFHNGVNYFVYVVGHNGNEYKLLQASQPILEDNKNILFGDFEEKIQMFIQKEEQKGNIIGSDGNLIKTNIATTKQLMQDEGSLYNKFNSLKTPYSTYEYKGTTGLTVDQYLKYEENVIKTYALDDPLDPGTHPYPSSIKIRITSQNTTSTINFTTYIKNVVPNEWGTYKDQNGSWHEMPSSALQAGAMAVKCYAWQRVYSHKYPNSGYDLKDNEEDQVYKADSALTSCSAAVDAVAGRIIVNSDNKLFLAAYLPGTYSSAGVGGGTAYQHGAAYLANSSIFYDWFTILSWYYDDSLRSPNGNCKFYYY